MEPLLQESTPSIIAERVRQAIAKGDLPPGSQLGEAELAREFGVSRGPLREGLQRLTAEGLLISIRNRGLFVIEMTADRVRDMYVARQAVERAAAEQIHLGDDATAAGRQLLDVVEEMAEAKTVRDVGELDITFHDRLVTLAGSPRLSRMHLTLLTETQICIRALEPTYALEDVRVEEHREIAQSFIAGKRALTDRLLVAHMKDAVRRLTRG
ncbi:GntR family transcriptional regulator [Intrasporangium chromatireducens Q5-1]|uniref:GntR family transcriptional regulator n=1 Tax=Intrasporangium chromatireducens Q5-1 TaxID=584657 RepID=W9GN72_9MICO|nr:GntR family transcriptional regulator [Intrasporangium chromatireducens]EWT06507.1 GntR family transcriptional regulator [Intrasporangium chromatireducens Q5-1]